MEELDSDDDTDSQGVGLNFGEKRFHSDPLHFTGYDLATTKARKPYAFAEQESESASSEEDSENTERGGVVALQVALRDKEDTLVESALRRIRRAQEKGKGDVKLRQEEVDALERRRKRMQSAATAKAKKEGSSSGGSGGEKRRRREENMVTIPLAPPATEPVGRKKKKSSRRSDDETQPHAANHPPGMLFAGPDGLTYAPVGYYPPQAPSGRSSPGRSPGRPRSYTAQSRGAPPPPASNNQTNGTRHYSDGMRPESSSSSSSRRPLPDEEHWRPVRSRRSSNASPQPYAADPFEYQLPSESPPQVSQKYMQQQSGRRYLTGPSEVSYASVRRSLPGYPASARAPSDPPVRTRGSRHERDELASTSSDTEDSDSSGRHGAKVYVEEPVVIEKEEKKPVSRKPVASGKAKKKGKGK